MESLGLLDEVLDEYVIIQSSGYLPCVVLFTFDYVVCVEDRI